MEADDEAALPSPFVFSFLGSNESGTGVCRFVNPGDMIGLRYGYVC